MNQQTQATSDTVSLYLTRDQARFLLDLLNKVGGSPKESRRRHASGIMRQLWAWSVEESGRNDFVIGRNAIWMTDAEGKWPGGPADSLPVLQDAR